MISQCTTPCWASSHTSPTPDISLKGFSSWFRWFPYLEYTASACKKEILCKSCLKFTTLSGHRFSLNTYHHVLRLLDLDASVHIGDTTSYEGDKCRISPLFEGGTTIGNVEDQVGWPITGPVRCSCIRLVRSSPCDNRIIVIKVLQSDASFCCDAYVDSIGL